MVRSCIYFVFLLFFSSGLAFSKEIEPFLKLQVVFTGTSPLYPGERAYVGYQYLYNTNMDLKKEILPLLDAKGFKKIGDKAIVQKEENGVSLTQVVQKIQAVTAGDFSFGPSIIEGVPYIEDLSGEKQYIKSLLKSEALPITITVAPFPVEGRPASFRGAVGNYAFEAKLMGSDTVHVGDKIELLLTVSGKGEWDELLPPDLCCQPGFSGFIKMEDLPPITKIQENAKSFLINFKVENPELHAIPEIEFSYFNPSLKTYEKKSSPSIPLKVVGGLSKIAPPLLSVPEEGFNPLPDISLLLNQEQKEKMEPALKLYFQGVKEEGSLQKSEAFNQSLAELMKMDSSESLNKALMAMNLLQLGEYPLAAYYMLQALYQDGGNVNFQSGLNEIIKRGELPLTVPKFTHLNWRLWKNLFLLSLGVAFVWFFVRGNFWAVSAGLSFFALALLSLFYVGVFYFSPLYGVIIRSQVLYQQEGGGVSVSSVPVSAGALVAVLDAKEGGKWLKVRTEEGVLGYVPEKAIRVLH